MTTTIHTVDPDYDTIIVLRNANTGSTKVEGPEPTEYVLAKQPEAIQDTAAADTEDEGAIHYHVSSRHLKIASPWFKRTMSKEGWAESKLENGHFQVLAHDWDEQAFLLVLNIFHLRNKQVPRTIDLELLAKVAILVDYYECGEAIELFTAMWIDELKKTAIPATYCRDLLLWIWVAFMFQLHEQFENATAVAIKECKGTMDTLELPIPASVSSEVDLRRYQAIESVVGGLHNLLHKYRSSAYACKQDTTLSFQCGSFLLGALTKELHHCSLLFPRPEIPFTGLSFSGICKMVGSVKSALWARPKVYHPYSSSYGDSEQHGCDLKAAVGEIIDAAATGVAGLGLG